ncbi:transposase [Dankookia rubra]|uniref:Transposase n=1 Tax=Dankookia rubra TaxID=1442381 RepID=A0A4R5Q7D4_9PROT|nr:transposase [Dankookia rubra]
MALADPTRRDPVSACSDAALLEHIRAQVLGSRLHGEGYRKIWARLRHAGIRTSARRVRRLMGQHGLLAPHRVGRPEQRARDGTITTTVVDAIWGIDMTETVTVREGRARVFVAVDHCSGECVGNHAARSGNRFEALEPVRQVSVAAAAHCDAAYRRDARAGWARRCHRGPPRLRTLLRPIV